MDLYRKFLQPEYGEAAPEVNIMEPRSWIWSIGKNGEFKAITNQ